MIDMHLHTVFSDGQMLNIKQIVDNCKIISITDHNTTLAYDYFVGRIGKSKMILGCEVTVVKAPDYLIYFPGKKFSLDIENELKKIRLAEEAVIRQCYESLGYSHWDRDIERAYPSFQKIRNARTRDLAAIIHLYKNNMDYDNGFFDADDLDIARKQRREYGSPVSEDTAFKISGMHNGVIVLAHPIYTSIKRCSTGNANITVIKEKLVALLDFYADKSGRTVEWEYFSEESINRCQLSLADMEELRKLVMDKANEHGFMFTIGSDSHSLEGYASALCWLCDNVKRIRTKLANWIRVAGEMAF